MCNQNKKFLQATGAINQAFKSSLVQENTRLNI